MFHLKLNASFNCFQNQWPLKTWLSPPKKKHQLFFPRQRFNKSHPPTPSPPWPHHFFKYPKRCAERVPLTSCNWKSSCAVSVNPCGGHQINLGSSSQHFGHFWRYLGGGFKHVFFSSLFGEDFQFDQYVSNGLKPPTRYSWMFLFGFLTFFSLKVWDFHFGWGGSRQQWSS